MRGNINKELLVCPFESGSEVLVPKGSASFTDNPKYPVQIYINHDYSVTVENVYLGGYAYLNNVGYQTHEKTDRFCKDRLGNKMLYGPSFSFEDEEGQRKWVKVTPELLEHNGIKPQYLTAEDVLPF